MIVRYVKLVRPFARAASRFEEEVVACGVGVVGAVVVAAVGIVVEAREEGLVAALLQLASGTGAFFCSCFTWRKNPTGQSKSLNHSNSFSESSNLRKG